MMNHSEKCLCLRKCLWRGRKSVKGKMIRLDEYVTLKSCHMSPGVFMFDRDHVGVVIIYFYFDYMI
jgi:hypothetical protein